MGRMAVLLSSILFVIAFGVVGCGVGGDPAVAVVNDKEIGRGQLQERLDQIIPAYEAQGVALDEATMGTLEQQVLDEMITEEMLIQNAAQEGFTAADEDVQAQYDQLASQAGEAFNQQMEEQELTPETIRGLIARQLSIQQYLESKVEGADIQVTDADVQTFYDQYKAQGGESVPPLEELRTQIVAQLEQQEEGEFVQAFIADLKAQSNIEVLL